VSWGGNFEACLFFFLVGEPLPIPRIKNPDKETVDKYHALYISALRKLFDQHKVEYGLPETQELTIV
jgi:diacylglycerol O-acyltransferase 2-like protein 6